MHIGVIPSSTSNSKILLPYLSVHEVRLNTADIFKGCFYFEGFESNTKSAHKFLLGF